MNAPIRVSLDASAIPAAALVLATPVATWFLVGDLSATRFDDLDHLGRAPALPAEVELVLGVLAALVVLASAAVLARALRRGQVRRQWSATVVPLWVAGALLGYAGRVVSAGVIGANIGGAMVLLLGLPLAEILVGAAVVKVAVERRRSG